MTQPVRSLASTTGADPILDELIEAFANRLQTGERVDLEEYAREHAERADELRRILPALVVLADLGRSTDARPGKIRSVADPSGEAVGTLGDFRILREVGRGGMGVVYEAEQISLGRRVALKVLPFAAAMDARQLQRFKNEAQAAAQVHHTNIVPVISVGCERGVHYYAMQFIEGQTLAAVIRDLRPLAGSPPTDAAGRPAVAGSLAGEMASGRWAPARRKGADSQRTTDYVSTAVPPSPSAGETTAQPVAALSTERSTKSPAFFRTVAQLGVQAAEALEHAHLLGIIHRDIKPANLLMDAGGRLWITDFGLAHCQSQPGLTMTGDLLGTLRYMSPEQALAQRIAVDARTDVYSLGVTLYELLALEPAYNGRSREEVLRQIAFEEPRPPHRQNKAVPAELETIVLKAMAKNPEERFATAQELAEDLRRFLEDKPIRAKRPSLRQRAVKWARRHKTVVRAAFVVFLVVVAALVVSTALIWEKNKELEQSLQRERQNAYYQRIALAEREWHANNLGRWEQLLQNCSPDLRGWEWHYLKGLLRKGLPPMRHNTSVLSAAFSPDGKRIASASQDGFIKFWDARTGRELHSFLAHNGHARSVAFSSDGLRLASAGWDGKVKVWDIRTDPPVLAWERRASGQNHSVAFSPKGDLVVSGGEEPNAVAGTVRIWDAATGAAIWTHRGNEILVRSVAFSPDGRYLASASVVRKEAGQPVHTVKVWDVETREVRAVYRGRLGGVRGLAFSPDGRLLAFANIVWDWQAGRERFTFEERGTGVAFSPDGRRLAMAGMDQTVKVWDLTTGQEALTLRGHHNAVWSVAFSPDGDRLVSASSDLTVRIWDARAWQDGEKGQELLTLSGDAGHVNSVAFHPQGRLLASAGADGTVKFWDPLTGKNQLTLRVSTAPVWSVAFSADGKWLATAGGDKKAKVWAVNPGRTGVVSSPIHRLAGHNSEVHAIGFSRDSRRLASGSMPGSVDCVRVWDTTTGKEIQQLRDHTWAIVSVAFSPDGLYLASASPDTTMRVWDLTSGEEMVRPQPQHVGDVTSVAFSLDGILLASGSMDRTVHVWEKGGNAKTWKLRHLLRDLTGGVRSVAFSHDGRRLVWGSTDATLKVCELATEEIHTLRGHRDWVQCVAFSPDGKQIASASRDGTVKIWETPPVVKRLGGKAKNAKP
jgi:WD40 repeat protein/serine/threonine protein kinase